MAFPAHFIEEIKNRISVSSVVGRHVKLQRRGREYVGLSPFKSEKTPSFTVNDDKQFYHCFATGKHGSIFDFLMETQGLSFVEAIERLAAEAGLSMPERDPQEAAKAEQRQGLSHWMTKASEWFIQQLNTSDAANARDYLSRRGLGQELKDKFGVGYAPAHKNGLSGYLTGLGASPEDLLSAGLTIKPDDGRPMFDRFRDRIMFPIHDARGRVIAFGGRALDPNAPAKYLNSPETPLFHKGANLYNFHRARQPSYEAKRILVTEGYMDVIGLSRVGIDDAVAPLGTAVTEQQIDLLWRLTPEPILCLDGDSAGLRAAYRVIDRALPLLKPGYSLRFALLPMGKDPDDLARDGGREAIESVIERAVSLVDLLWDRELEQAPLDTPERRAHLRQRLRACVQQIQNRDIKELYGHDIKARLDKLFAPAPVPSQKGGRMTRHFTRSDARQETRRSAAAWASNGNLSGRSALLIAGLIAHPQLAMRHEELLHRIEFSDHELRRLLDEIVNFSSISETLDTRALTGHLKGQALDGLVARIEQIAKAHGLLFTRPDTEFNEAEAAWLEVAQIHHTLITLEREKAEAEADYAVCTADDEVESFERLKAIKKEIEEFEARTF